MRLGMPGSELGENWRQIREKQAGRFAWEGKPKTEDENENEDDYDWGTRTRRDRSETTKSAIDRSASFRNRPRSISDAGYKQPELGGLTSAGRSPRGDRFPRAEAPFQAHHPMTLRSLRNFPLKVCGASVASQTAVSAPSSTDRVAFAPPISVRTHPGHITLTAMPSELSA